MTYLEHLFSVTRLKAAAWIFLAGIIATVGASLSQYNILTLTWTDIKVAIIAAIVSQVTKAATNYVSAQAPNQ